MSILACALLLLAGLAMGATSIGGIVLVPVLTTMAGLPLHEAVATSSFAFLFSGVAALAVPAIASRRHPPEVALMDPGGQCSRPSAMLFVLALVGAACGALTLTLVPALAMRVGIAALAIASGALAWRAPARAEAVAGKVFAPLSVGRMAVLGWITGCGSAWSGTGGPIILLPLLLLLQQSPRTAVTLAQMIQLPIAVAALAVNLAAGQLNPGWGLMAGMLLAAGWVAGWCLARRTATPILRRGLSLALIVTGGWFGWGAFSGEGA